MRQDFNKTIGDNDGRMTDGEQLLCFHTSSLTHFAVAIARLQNQTHHNNNNQSQQQHSALPSLIVR